MSLYGSCKSNPNYYADTNSNSRIKINHDHKTTKNYKHLRNFEQHDIKSGMHTLLVFTLHYSGLDFLKAMYHTHFTYSIQGSSSNSGSLIFE